MDIWMYVDIQARLGMGEEKTTWELARSGSHMQCIPGTCSISIIMVVGEEAGAWPHATGLYSVTGQVGDKASAWDGNSETAVGEAWRKDRRSGDTEIQLVWGSSHIDVLALHSGISPTSAVRQ